MLFCMPGDSPLPSERRSMHHESIKALYDGFPLEEKNDFFPAYIYLKYIHHFMTHVLGTLGIPTKPMPDQLPADIQAMMGAYSDQIAEASPLLETSIYHGKVVKLADAIKLVTQKQDLDIKPPEQVVPFKVARDIILRNPGSIAVGTCPCRSASENPCMPPPQEVCMFVGDPWATFISNNNDKYRLISQEEAVHVLELTHKMGNVHCAFFKKEFRNSFAAICNCCSCCCLGVKMWNLLGGTVPILAPSGYTAIVNPDRCTGCDVCTDKCCPFQAISLDKEADVAVIDVAKCMGCGVCEDLCPAGAIKLGLDASKGEPLDLDVLVNGS